MSYVATSMIGSPFRVFLHAFSGSPRIHSCLVAKHKMTLRKNKYGVII